MAHIVQQGSGVEDVPVLGQGGIEPLQLLQGHPRHRQHADGMGEAAGFRPMEGEKGRPQLADAAQPLEGCRVDQVDRQGFGGILAIQSDRAVQRIVVRALAHGSSPGAASSATNNVAAACRQVSPSPSGSRGSGWGSSTSGSMPWFWMSRPLGVR